MHVALCNQAYSATREEQFEQECLHTCTCRMQLEHVCHFWFNAAFSNDTAPYVYNQVSIKGLELIKGSLCGCNR